MTVQLMLATAGALRPIPVAPRLLPADLESLLETSHPHDILTQNIEVWFSNFKNALSLWERGASRIEQIEREFFALLKELLKDPITDEPLDENCMLGSDGITYAKQTLDIHTIGVPEQYQRRSPLYPNREENFTTQVHPIARYLVSWLKSRDHSFEADIATARQRSSQSIVNRLRAQRIATLHAERLARREAEIEALAEEGTAALRARICDMLNPIREHQEREDARVEQVLVEARARHEARVDATAANLDIMDERLDRIEEGIEALERRQDQTDEALEEERINNEKTDLLIQQTAETINKCKKSFEESFLQTLAIVGACYFGAWAAAKMSGGAATGAVSASKGVPMGGFTLPV